MSERCMYCLGLSSQAKEGTEVSIEESYLVVSHECMCCMQGEYCETSCQEGIKAYLDKEAK